MEMMKLLRRLLQGVYRLYGIRGNVKLGKNVTLGSGTYIWPPQEMIIGDNVRIAKNCTIECNGRIGNNVIMANLVGLLGREDYDYSHGIGIPIGDVPHIRRPGFQGSAKDLKLIIEDDVWIGYAATILTGVCVGRGAIIAAGSIVTKDVPPYSIVAGNPAHIVSTRYNSQQIEEHEKILYGRVITPTNE